ncbi:MAG: tRNA (guanosine(37)-N1)-methyltransferase TrmD [Flavobacteriales bacterium]|nr:tRNA (guanosine(37)-N1)-methyltransferase TrmD [Flavobacteriales bacterium]
MRIDIISVLPEIMESPLSHSIIQRAKQKNLVEINLVGLRDFGIGNYKQVDDYPYGGGGGMVLRAEPLATCIESLYTQHTYDDVIYLTPDGYLLNQKIANQLSIKQNLLLICGHYKGIDQRIRDKYVTLEISIGDYVLSGGELAACVLTDTLIRLIPGVLGDEMSALSDSFQDGLLAPPVYTRPEVWDGRSVPEVLISGHDQKIAEWRLDQSIARTRKRRPDLLNE